MMGIEVGEVEYIMIEPQTGKPIVREQRVLEGYEVKTVFDKKERYDYQGTHQMDKNRVMERTIPNISILGE
jgi:hypothetical protein